MKRQRLHWIPKPQPAAPPEGFAVTAEAGPPPTWPGDPTLSDRDEFIFLLQTASEIEHALMVQYLYSAWSVPSKPDWASAIIKVAKQEMGHLVTVQNLLRSLNAPLSLDRDDYPFRSELYPFEFRLEKLTAGSLAKYVVAEMPADPGLSQQEMDSILADAGIAGGDKVNRVGDLYDRLRDIVERKLTDANFNPSTAPMQALPDSWLADEENGVIVQTVASKADALEALRKIADQGEGNESQSDETSHFDIFLVIYRDRKEATSDPASPVVDNPNTSPAPSEGLDDLADGRISHRRARLWALLGNVRYRMLLSNIHHALSLPTDLNGPEAEVRLRAIAEMHLLSPISRVLLELPRAATDDGKKAGMPFEMPYSLDFPDGKLGRYLLHLDLVQSSQKLVQRIEDAIAGGSTPAPTPQEIALVQRIKADDDMRLAAVKAQVVAAGGNIGGVAKLTGLRLLPSLAIARFGSSPQPMDNYDLGEPGADGWAPLLPAETLQVDDSSGQIEGTRTPTSVNFRDADGLVKPVCPFIEVWAQFDGTGPLRPLSILDLQQLGLNASDLRWRVQAANGKAERRTGEAADAVLADTGVFNEHTIKSLNGRAQNFKAGRSIPFGSVRYIAPNALFPELRLRFTPAPGKVFGPVAGDPNTVADVYDSAAGGWDNHFDGVDGAPPFTLPANLYYGRQVGGDWVSAGYLDDACDAIVSVELTLPSQAEPLRAIARVSSGPPHFSPETLPVRSVADDLEQMLAGPEIAAPTTPAEAEALGEKAAEIIRRALGTVRLMNTAAMNRGGMASHDSGVGAQFGPDGIVVPGRLREPIFSPLSRADYTEVEARHRDVLTALAGIKSPAGSPERAAAVSALEQMEELLRRYDQVGDLSNSGRRRMPAMMRGADGLHLALTRRQVSIVEKAATALGTSVPGPMTPEEQMLALVAHFSANANRHTEIDTGGNTPLSQLFGNPPDVLAYLQRGLVQGLDAPPELLGQPWITPGDPAGSAFFVLVQTPGHPMRSRFALTIPSIGSKTGVQIVQEWIASLPVA
jgi:hypothetical protein